MAKLHRVLRTSEDWQEHEKTLERIAAPKKIPKPKPLVSDGVYNDGCIHRDNLSFSYTEDSRKMETIRFETVGLVIDTGTSEKTETQRSISRIAESSRL